MHIYAGTTKVGLVSWIRPAQDKVGIQVGRFLFTTTLKVFRSGTPRKGAQVDVTFDDTGVIKRARVRATLHECTAWSSISYGGKPLSVSLRCSTCEVVRSRLTTKAEGRILLRDSPLSRTLPKDNVHRVWHDFTRRFQDKDQKFLFTSWDLMCRVERWAKKYPDEVRIVGCDDNHFASSDLVLVEHRTADQYMGTSVVYIPQCSGEDPIVFFLYPSHRESLVKALQEIGKEAKVVKARQRVKDRDRSLTLKKLFEKG